jgi:tRNA A-37 threonylcarbamoyl transferase component Bud32
MLKEILRKIYSSEEIVNENIKLIEILSSEIGRILGKLHENDIVHGDLTTSNMLVKIKY